MTAPTPIDFHALPPRPRGRPKTEDVEAIETRLIATALRSFIAHGYGATSMASIARAARVSKNTLYARFASKADLFRAIITSRLATTEAGQRAGERRDQPLKAILSAYIQHMMRESLSGDLLQINRLIYSEAGRFPELGQAASERMAVGVRQVAQLLIEAGARDGIAVRDPEKAAALLLMLTRGWYSEKLLIGETVGDAPLRAIADDMVDHFLASRALW